MVSREQVRALLYGIAVGDALGLPVELRQRVDLEAKPITDLTGHGTHDQPLGTWSDDTATALGQAEALAERVPAELDKLEADTQEMLLRWYEDAEWTANGAHFDISLSMRSAMMYLESGVQPREMPEYVAHATGNDALVRCLPFALMLVNRPADELPISVITATQLTHPNPQALVASVLAVHLAVALLNGESLAEGIRGLHAHVEGASKAAHLPAEHAERLLPIVEGSITQAEVNEMNASGDALDTLLVSLACLAQTTDYSSAVLKAVNLGDDADTNGALVGGLAALAYGLNNIPGAWVKQIARTAEIGDLADRLALNLA
jgi:ADP-ribosylglycohydrolase